MSLKRSRSQTIILDAPAAKRKKSLKRIPYPRNGISSSARARLKYSVVISLDPSAVTAVHNFAANGLFDPDLTYAGAQPIGFDQWMALYDVYTVTGAKLTARYVSHSTSTQNPALFGVSCSDTLNYSSATTEQTVISRAGDSNPAAPTSRMVNTGVIPGINTGATKVAVKYDQKKMMGIRDANGRTSLEGSASSNPSDLAYFQVFACSVLGNTPGSIQGILVDIEYDVMFTAPKALSMS